MIKNISFDEWWGDEKGFKLVLVKGELLLIELEEIS